MSILFIIYKVKNKLLIAEEYCAVRLSYFHDYVCVLLIYYII